MLALQVLAFPADVGLGGRGVLLFGVQGRQVDAGVAAAQFGVGGQRSLPGRLGGVVPGRADFGHLLECLPANPGLLGA